MPFGRWQDLRGRRRWYPAMDQTIHWQLPCRGGVAFQTEHKNPTNAIYKILLMPTGHLQHCVDTREAKLDYYLHGYVKAPLPFTCLCKRTITIHVLMSKFHHHLHVYVKVPLPLTS